MLEGGVFTPTSTANHKAPAGSASALNKVPLSALKEVRSALNKTKLKDNSAAVVTQMKPIPKVRIVLIF